MTALAPLIDHLAAPNHGVVSAHNLIDHGVSRRQIDTLRRTGRLIRLTSDVYRVAGGGTSTIARIRGALVAAGPTAAASHRTAAWMLGLDGFVEPEVVEILVHHRLRQRELGAGVLLHSSAALGRLDRVEAWGCGVTSAARTVIDLAAVGASATELGAAIDSAARLGLASPDFVRRRLGVIGRRGRTGVRQLDEVMLDAGGHSHLERRFLTLLRHAGVPRPACQVVHRTDGRTVARVDFQWSLTVVAEVNGRRGHASDTDRTKDASRRNALQQRGMVVLEFTTVHVIDDPRYVVTAVADALRSRGLHG